MFDPDADLVSGLLRLGLEGVGRGRGSHTWHANEEKKKVASRLPRKTKKRSTSSSTTEHQIRSPIEHTLHGSSSTSVQCVFSVLEALSCGDPLRQGGYPIRASLDEQWQRPTWEGRASRLQSERRIRSGIPIR